MRFRSSAVLLLPALLGCGVSTAFSQSDPPATQPASVPLSTLGDATRVTLKLDNAKPKEAFAKLEQASHVQIANMQGDQWSRGDDHLINVNFTNTPYLEAVLELCQQGNLMLNFGGGRLSVMPLPDQRLTPPHAVAGPLLVSNLGVVINHDIRYGEKPTKTASAQLNCIVFSEPRISVLGIDGPPVNVRAIDVNGKVLAPVDLPHPVQQRGRIDALNPNRAFGMQLALDPAAAESLKSVSGTLYVRTITKTKTLTIKDLLSAEGYTGSVGDSSFTVAHIDQNNPNQFRVAMEVRSPSLPPNFFMQMQFANQQFVPKLEGQPGGVQLLNPQIQGDHLLMTLLINLPQMTGDESNRKPIDLVWPLPAEISRVEVPFELKDIKLH